jgi:phosphoglycolate phosphatase-like HAD superfamily hydrolase
MKIGDTTNDIKEGINAGCGQTIGVLSGASERHKLINAGADAVIKKVTDLKDCDLPVFLL